MSEDQQQPQQPEQSEQPEQAERSEQPRFKPMQELGKLSQQAGKLIEQGVKQAQTFTGGQMVRLDVYEVDDEVIVKTNSLDGLDPQTIEVAMEGDVLTIKGETKPDDYPPLASFFLQERKYGAFSRNVTIPIPVRSEEARAKLAKNGVLTITLPVDTDRYQDITVTPAD